MKDGKEIEHKRVMKMVEDFNHFVEAAIQDGIYEDFGDDEAFLSACLESFIVSREGMNDENA